MKLIDIHAHILPGLDDGASGQEESLKMIQMAEKQGISAIVATPHHSPQFPNSRQDVLEAYKRLKEAATGKTSVQIFCGQEIFYSEDTIEQLRAGEQMTMAGSSWILVEFMPFDPFTRIFQGCSRLLSAGYGIILAHVERYDCLRDPAHVEELLRMGVKFQMNFRPIGGAWYGKTTRWCRTMLKEYKIHFLGTDMHNTDKRSPETQQAISWMRKHLEDEYLQAVCWENAEKILGLSGRGELTECYSKGYNHTNTEMY